MKPLSRLLVLTLFLVSTFPAAAQLHDAKIELYPISGGASEVRIGARMTPVATSLSVEAVSVAVAYDLSLFSVNANTSIQNMYFAQHGWDDASSPEWQTQQAPGVCVYGEYHPNFGCQTVFRGAPATLCEFVFYPKSSAPGTADFTVYANNPTAALTYYFVCQVSGQKNFNPVVNITGMYYPVELSSFTAAQQGQAVALRWTTQSEDGNYGFHVERMRAEDAMAEWSSIGFVEGHGDTRMAQQYLFFDWEIERDGMYAYRLRQEDFDGRTHLSDPVYVEYVGTPLQFALRQNYPNPVSLSGGQGTAIAYDIAERSRIRLSVSNLLGQEIAVIADRELDAGSYSSTWQPLDIPAGTYVVTLVAQSAVSGSSDVRHLRVQVVR